jgi:hypothetical protein
LLLPPLTGVELRLAVAVELARVAKKLAVEAIDAI